MHRYACRRRHLYVLRESAPDYLVTDSASESTVREPARAAAPTDSTGPADPDALDDLADEITILAAHIHAATARLLELIAEFDRLGGWRRGGHRSCAGTRRQRRWVGLAFRTGIGLPTAREKVRALTRAATPDNEEDLLELARGCTTAQIERVVRAWKKHSRAQEADLERALHETRGFSVFPDDEGMYVVRGKLPPEVGALLMRAVEAAGDQLFREENPAAPEEDTREAARQRRADALGLIVDHSPWASGARAMAAGFSEDAPVSGARAERYQVVVHVSPETLQEESHSADGDVARPRVEGRDVRRSRPGDAGSDRSHLEDGTRVSAETSRRLSCDAATVRMSHDPEGSILDVGRRTRTIPPALRRALDARDRGCRFPGCGLRFTDAHHVRHWVDGGAHPSSPKTKPRRFRRTWSGRWSGRTEHAESIPTGPPPRPSGSARTTFPTRSTFGAWKRRPDRTCRSARLFHSRTPAKSRARPVSAISAWRLGDRPGMPSLDPAACLKEIRQD